MKKLTLFNSLGRRKIPFSPAGRKIGVYVCGITPDAPTHAGHAFVFTSFDVLLRYLKHLGYTVRYIQNITDIDDDILRRAKAKGKNWKKFGKEHTRQFLEDMKWLRNRKPDISPKATQHIQEMLRIIRVLLEKKVAYEKNGSVYFEVAKDKNYGKLSRLSKKAMLKIANERGNYPDDPNKKEPLDFVLWQAKKKGLSARAGEPSWVSPWGKGRPGWHIECSAMAMKYLGATVDIQGGGSDLIFPHHESSIVQSQNATGKPYARFWLHVGMVRYEGEKMAKSLGNVVLLRDLKKKYSANTFRIFLLSHHYRSSFEFKEKDIAKAKKINELLQNAVNRKGKKARPLDVSFFKKEFYGAMNDDMHTPKALNALAGLAKEMIRDNQERSITHARAFFVEAFGILGLTIE